MTTASYLSNRFKWSRPQAILFAENEPQILNGMYVPLGLEVGADPTEYTEEEINQFLILSDHNRGALSFNSDRIETRSRTINGTMRSYYIADKLNLSTSWTNLPSRSFLSAPYFDETGTSTLTNTSGQYTVDGGAGGVDLLNWYETHPGSFWVYLAYDKHTEFSGNENQYAKLGEYNQAIEMFFADFTYSVEKRGQSNHDFWNVNIRLEEV